MAMSEKTGARSVERKAPGKRHAGRRYGAAAVETALVMIPLTMFIFGIFEYGRLLMDWNVLNNAAREGCRYAVVNNTASTISADVQGVVTTRLGREIASFSNLTVTVTGTHNGVSSTVNSLGPGDMISVTVSGTYKFMNVIPFHPMPSLAITSSVTMVCEGGT
jgi:Flp pilus assembly protein TadG